MHFHCDSCSLTWTYSDPSVGPMRITREHLDELDGVA